ncbi:MAG TPA: CoA transferase [Stellaceae bacterium]|nr:CoA transferase [Stellaceae bacterium]
MPLADFLRGIRVVDVSQFIPGPQAALHLGDLGADVVKVEPPGGEPMRTFPPLDPDGVGASYKLMNRGKTVVELDLKTETGQRAFADLIAAADVLVESYRPGVLDRLGFDRKTLERLNPGLVHVALTGFGQTGPYRARAGHDINYMALAGGLAASGTEERPVAAYPPTADHASALQAALAAVAALFRRRATGRGAFIDVSLAETVLAWQAIPMTLARRAGQEPHRGAQILNGGTARYHVYRTSDGRFITLGAVERKFWDAFCRAVGHDDWAVRYDDPLPQTRLIAEVAALIASQPLADWECVIDPADCCFHPVVDLADLPDHPQIAERRLVHRVSDDPALVETLFPAWVDGAPPAPRVPLRFAAVSDVLARWQKLAR